MATASNSRVLRTIPLILIVVLFCPFAHGKVIYVDHDATGAHDGSNWTDGYQCLQDALADVRPGDEIRVAQGIYKPDQRFWLGRGGAKVISSGYRTETFQLINRVAIKGGYAGFGEPDPDARDIKLYETILSGDLDGNDRPYFKNNNENSYHVVTGNGTDEMAVLDGFAITAGNANGNQPYNAGGGMLNDFGSPTVTNCTFSGNSAEHGGGMRNRDNSPTLTHCTFENNSAGGAGGGMSNAGDQGTPVVTDCTFSGNTADYGAGMNNDDGSSTVVRNCTFTGNSAEQGGGMFNHYLGSPIVTNCTFTSNSAKLGGGMWNQNCTAIVTDCTFSGNAADIAGGGMNNDSNGNPKVTNCTFTGNSAQNSGGGMLNFWDSSPTVANCTFEDNSAGWDGGGMFNGDRGNPIVTNCTFTGNLAQGSGGGVWINDSRAKLTNCILWGNTATSGLQLALHRNSSVVIDYCDLKGGLPGIDVDPSSFVTWGLGNTDADPLFVNAANADYHLQASSPCIDAGDNSAIPAGVIVDLDGNPRIINSIVDMGAYEYSRTSQYLRAGNPSPANGAEYVYPNVELSWSSGFGAQKHIVYFGDNFDDVHIDAGGIAQETTTYTTGPLEWDKVYYWRVDEFDGAVIHKGDVWSFRTIPEIDPTLIGWWRFDEGSGAIANDSSGNGNVGTFNGDPQWVPGHSGYALEFDGSGDWLDCGEDPIFQIKDAVTVAAWIKVGAQGIDHKIGGNQDGANGGYKMTIHHNRVEFEIRTATNSAGLNRNVSGGAEIMVDVWYHVTGVYSLGGGYIRTYVNGVLDREMSTTDTLGASPGSFKIGCEPFTTGLYNFNGVMDDLRIYNRALTEADILAAMEDRPVEDFENNNFSKFPWSSYGDESWDTTRQEKYSGSYSAQAGPIEDGESSTLEVSLDCLMLLENN
ncbi:LamG-like jellyroll fold domain-containing protein [Planctomycetota bacterium]